ncbi:MAG: FHA domain-containing protein [Acidimicrobiia bacterium]
MVCTRCGHRNEPSARFCSSCGSPLEPQHEGHPGDSTVEIPTLPSVPRGGAVLHVLRGPNAGSTYLLDRDETSIGRHPDSSIFLDDITVSRRHSSVDRGGEGSFTIRDAGSLNGTYVNRERVEACELADGDEVQVGRFHLVFHRGE